MLGRPELANAGGFTTAEARSASRGAPGRASSVPSSVDLILGGSSEDRVSKIGKLPVNE
jgi:hypothetical protein